MKNADRRLDLEPASTAAPAIWVIRSWWVTLLGAVLVGGLLPPTVGCTRWKQISQDRKTLNIASNVADEPYLASVLAYRAGLVEEAVVVVAFNLNSLSVGKGQFVVVNKWGRLPAGKYVDRIKILGPDRKTQIAADQTDFESQGELRNMTVLSQFEVEFKEPGAHWVQVYLGDRLMVEYPFQVFSKGQSGATNPPASTGP